MCGVDQAILACALPSGSISLVRVRQRYNTSSDELEVTSEIIESELDLLPASADDAGITALEWITLRSGAVSAQKLVLLRVAETRSLPVAGPRALQTRCYLTILPP